jgi:hypothetical protein
MKARSKELLDRAVAVMVAAIEIYNKPDFLYREETFAGLAVNGWELRISVPWLAERGGCAIWRLEERRRALVLVAVIGGCFWRGSGL